LRIGAILITASYTGRHKTPLGKLTASQRGCERPQARVEYMRVTHASSGSGLNFGISFPRILFSSDFDIITRIYRVSSANKKGA